MAGPPAKQSPFEDIIQRLEGCLYRVRVLFNQDFFGAPAVVRKEVIEKLSKLRNEGDVSESFSPEEKVEIQKFCLKIEALLSVEEFMREGKLKFKSPEFNKLLEKALQDAENVGWNEFVKEPWREEFVERACGCSNLQAKEALKKSNDLRVAVGTAKTIKLNVMNVREKARTIKFKPPPQDLLKLSSELPIDDLEDN